jgi:transposase
MPQTDLLDPRVNGRPAMALLDPQVRPKAKRRQFSAEYKKRILEEAEACTEHGQLGALLRREGLYSSHLTNWRRQRDQMVLDGFTPKKRGPKPDPLAVENASLQREIERLEARLQRAETIIAFQKNLHSCSGSRWNRPRWTHRDDPAHATTCRHHRDCTRLSGARGTAQ